MKSFREIVETYEGRFTEADRALSSVILNDPKEVMFLTASGLAARARVHASTVVRMAHKMGFEGYPDLREKLREEFGGSARSNSNVGRRLQMIDKGSDLIKLIEGEIAALSAISKTLSQQEIDLAARLLVKASTIHLVGRGGAVPLVAHLDRRLRRSGFRATTNVRLQKRDLAEWFSGLRPDEVVVIFAFQAPASLPSGFCGLMNHIRRVGAKSVIISDAAGPTLRPLPDVLLSVTRPDEGAMSLRTGPMVVSEALAMATAHLDPQRAIKEIKALERLRSEMEE